MARFTDAPQGERCTAVVTLKDKSTADCGRRATIDDRCWQHARGRDESAIAATTRNHRSPTHSK